MNIEETSTPDETRRETEIVADLIRSAGRRTVPPEAAYVRDARSGDERMAREDRPHPPAPAFYAGRGQCRRRRGRAGGAVRARAARARCSRGPGGHAGSDHRRHRGPGSRVGRAGGCCRTTAQPGRGHGLRTGSPGSRAGLMLAGGSSLRLAEGTEVLLEAPARLQLVAGRAYVDSGRGERAGEPVEIVDTGRDGHRRGHAVRGQPLDGTIPPARARRPRGPAPRRGKQRRGRRGAAR